MENVGPNSLEGGIRNFLFARYSSMENVGSSVFVRGTRNFFSARYCSMKNSGPNSLGGFQTVVALVSGRSPAAKRRPVQLAKHLADFDRNGKALVMSGHLRIKMRFS